MLQTTSLMIGVALGSGAAGMALSNVMHSIADLRRDDARADAERWRLHGQCHTGAPIRINRRK